MRHRIVTKAVTLAFVAIELTTLLTVLLPASASAATTIKYAWQPQPGAGCSDAIIRETDTTTYGPPTPPQVGTIAYTCSRIYYDDSSHKIQMELVNTDKHNTMVVSDFFTSSSAHILGENGNIHLENTFTSTIQQNGGFKTNYALWVPSAGSTCTNVNLQTGSVAGIEVNSVLRYFNAGGNSSDFSCTSFNTNTVGGIGMELRGPQPPSQSCRDGSPNSITFEKDFTTSQVAVYKDASTADALSRCVQNNQKDIMIVNTYNDAQKAQTSSVGSGTWRSTQDPATISVMFVKSLGEHPQTACTAAASENQQPSCSLEVFTKSTLSGGEMTLTSSIKANSNCPNDEMVVGDNAKGISYQNTQYATVHAYDKPKLEPGGQFGCKTETGTITLTQSAAIAGTGTTTAPGGGDDGGCPIPGTEGVGYILCPIYNLSYGAITSLSKNVTSILYVNPDIIFGQPGQSFRSSYNVFRNFALSLIVIGGLVMVASEAAGVELLSPYAIRKALPRLVVAAIGIALAWPILEFVLTLFNDLGAGVSSIILLASNTAGTAQNTNGVGDFFGGATSSILIGGGFFTVLGTVGGLALLGSVLLSLVVAYVVLSIRQVVLILCILVAPLAIALSIFPNTEGVWKFWRNTLQTTLVMFPMIMAIFAASSTLSSIIGAMAGIASSSSTSGAPSSAGLAVLAIIVKVAPYFLLVNIIGMTGGVMGQITGAVKGASQGGFNFLKQQRSQAIAKNMQDIKSGSRFNDNWNKPLGRVLQGVSTGPKSAFGLNRAVARESMAINRAVGAAEAAKNPAMQQLGMDDDGIAAMFLSAGVDANSFDAMGGDIGRQFRTLNGLGNTPADDKRVREAVAKARAVGINSNNFVAANQLVAANKSRSLGSGQATLDTINRTLDRGSNGNAAVRQDLAGTFGFYSRGAGRTDLAGIITNEGMSGELGGQAVRTTAADGWKRTAMPELARSSDGAMKEHAKDIAALWRSGSYEKRIDAAQRYMEMQSILPQTDPATQSAINSILTSQGFDLSSRGTMPLEDWLSSQINTAVRNGQLRQAGLPPGAAPGAVSGGAIASRARVYDRQLQGTGQLQQQNQQNQPPPVATPPSDRRIKTNIRYVQILPNRIRLYSFQYIWGGPTYVGVMAQDLLETHPEAVSVAGNGYYQVDYSMLGLRMMELSEWKQLQGTAAKSKNSKRLVKPLR